MLDSYITLYYYHFIYYAMTNITDYAEMVHCDEINLNHFGICVQRY